MAILKDKKVIIIGDRGQYSGTSHRRMRKDRRR